MSLSAILPHYSDRSITIRLFLTCWLVYVMHFATNTVREVYPALSLGDHLSFDVSEYMGLHPDIFELPGGGAFINNNPGASILAAVPYTLTRPFINWVTRLVQIRRERFGNTAPEYRTIYPMAREFYAKVYQRGLDVKLGLADGVMQALLMAPLSSLSVVVMFKILIRLTQRRNASLALAVLYGFATPVFYRTATLNQNLLQADFALFSFFIIWQGSNHTSLHRKAGYLLSGFLAGWTLVLDYSGIILILALSLYVWLEWISLPVGKRARVYPLLFGGGMLASASVLFLYQWSAFGNPFFPAQHYMPPATYSSAGWIGMDWPKIDLIGLLTFGLRYGLFTSAPFLILSLYPFSWVAGRTRLVGWRETVFILALTTGFLLFTAANQYSRMQFNTGIRHIVPVTPFLFLIAAGTWMHIPRWLQWFSGVFSMFWMWCLAMVRDVEQGLGIPEAVIAVVQKGPSLPWLRTLELMGYVRVGYAVPVLASSMIWIAIIWLVRDCRKKPDSVLRQKEFIDDTI